MKIRVTIDANVNPVVAVVVRAWLKIPAEDLRRLVQERSPSGIAIEAVTIEEKTS